MRRDWSRREVLALGVALGAAAALWRPGMVLAGTSPIELGWEDLVPGDDGVMLQQLRELGGVVEHGQLSSPFEAQPVSAVTQEYDGKLVRLPGYLIPLEFDGTGGTEFILVPYVGACIHVPPPPANQLVFVEADRPYESRGLFDPVYVTGQMSSSVTETELAEIGYQISVAEIEPYDG